LALVSRSRYCVAIHGAKGKRAVVFVGGLDAALKDLLRDRLTAAGFVVADPVDPDLEGTSTRNICNRGASGAGAQLEITRGLREALTDRTDPQAPERLAAFAAAVRAAIDSNA
jgi:phage replication-related protein YjqB (UPF0714/DUF867 family)